MSAAFGPNSVAVELGGQRSGWPADDAGPSPASRDPAEGHRAADVHTNTAAVARKRTVPLLTLERCDARTAERRSAQARHPCCTRPPSALQRCSVTQFYRHNARHTALAVSGPGGRDGADGNYDAEAL